MPAPVDPRLDTFKTVSINSKNNSQVDDMPASLSRSFDARHNSSANPIVRHAARGQSPTNALGGTAGRSSLGAIGVRDVIGGDYSPPRFKASPTRANGGVGVTYSNVVLAGGLNPRDHPSNSFVSNKNMTTLQAMQAGERS